LDSPENLLSIAAGKWRFLSLGVLSPTPGALPQFARPAPSDLQFPPEPRQARAPAATRSRLGPTPHWAGAGPRLPTGPAFCSRARGPGSGRGAGLSTRYPAGAASGEE